MMRVGVLLVVLYPHHSAAQQPARWTAAAELRIGNVDDEKYALTSAGAVVIGPEGHIYVTQPQDNHIRVFDAAGRAVRTIGRRGAGPGEFEGLSSIGFLGDTLYATDFRQDRVTFFTRDGAVIATKRWASPQLGRFSPSPPYLLLRDGSGIVVPSVPSSAIASGEVTAIPYLRIDRSGAIIDTVAMRPHRKSQLAIQRNNGAMYTGQPFADDALVVLSPDGSSLAIVDRTAAQRGGRAEFRVTRTRVGAAATQPRAYAYEPLPIPRAYVDSLVAERTKAWAGRPNSFFTSVQDAEAAFRKELYLPGYFAPVTSAQFSQDGSLWLRREARPGQPQLWEIHSPTGVVTGTLNLPENARVLLIQANSIWTSETDDLDVPYVVRYRLQRAAAR